MKGNCTSILAFKVLYIFEIKNYLITNAHAYVFNFIRFVSVQQRDTTSTRYDKRSYI